MGSPDRLTGLGSHLRFSRAQMRSMLSSPAPTSMESRDGGSWGGATHHPRGALVEAALPRVLGATQGPSPTGRHCTSTDGHSAVTRTVSGAPGPSLGPRRTGEIRRLRFRRRSPPRRPPSRLEGKHPVICANRGFAKASALVVRCCGACAFSIGDSASSERRAHLRVAGGSR